MCVDDFVGCEFVQRRRSNVAFPASWLWRRGQCCQIRESLRTEWMALRVEARCKEERGISALACVETCIEITQKKKIVLV